MTKTTMIGAAAGFLAGAMLMTAAPAAWAACSDASANGAYSFNLTGVLVHGHGHGDNGPPFPASRFAAVGQITANGSGGITGVLSFSDNGKINSGVPVTGTYAVNADCTGTLTIDAAASLSLHFDATLDNAGAGAVGIETDPGTVATFVSHQ